MKVRQPYYYKQFKCTMSKCKDNCCRASWDIEVDEDAVDYYKASIYEDKLMNSIEDTEGYDCFKKKNGACVWLEKNGLCGMYGRFGEEYLANVCVQFPRFTEYFGDFKETGIGCACEEAVRIILESDINFKTEEIEEAYDVSDENCAEKINEKLKDFVFTLREELFKIFADGKMSSGRKLTIYLNVCSELQDVINSKEFLKEDADYKNRIYDTIERVTFDVLHKASYKDDISAETEEILTAFFEVPDMEEEYEKAHTKLEKLISKKYHGKKIIKAFKESRNVIEKQKRADDYDKFIIYLIYRYFGKAVFDGDILLKAKFAVAMYICLRLFDIYYLEINNNVMTLEDRIEQIKMISRQFEYSEDNMEQLTEDFLFEEGFSRAAFRKILAVFY